MIPAKPAAPARWYLRCAECLEIVMVIAPEAETRGVRCGICDGRLEVMGRVSVVRRLVLDDEETPCDERCTGATGPKCECPCGAENHGSGRLVPIVVDQGAVPRSAIRPGADLEALRARALETRAAVERVKALLDARYGWAFRLRAAVRYMEPDDYAAYCRGAGWSEALSKAKRLRTHKGRLARLAKLEEDMRRDTS